MRALSLLCASLWPLMIGEARAQVHHDDRLGLMHETIAYTDVIDAFDGDDRFDLNVQLEYARLSDSGTVYRERTTEGVRGQQAIARAQRELSQLALGVEVGLYRDLMAFVRLPLVLSDRRSLARPSGVGSDAIAARLRDDGDEQPLFAVPFTAPTRAGVDYLALGGAVALVNQMRRPQLPTWVLRVEGRRPLGQPLRPCRQRSTDVACGGSYTEDDGSSAGTRREGGSRGLSQGLGALLVETRFSRRYRHAEPYGGLGFQVSWPARFGRAERLSRFPTRGARPGSESTATLGVVLVPWENRGAFQRFAFDLRLDATHIATGYAYGALFDALGSSSNVALAQPRRACLDGIECRGEEAYFHGITEAAAHVRYGGQLGIEVQAARYVRFSVGASLRAVTAHALTGQSPCGATGQDDARGVCTDGIELARRAVIDAPGRRFFMRDELLIGAYAQAAAMF